jgi:hypothetical protein
MCVVMLHIGLQESPKKIHFDRTVGIKSECWLGTSESVRRCSVLSCSCCSVS